MTGGEAIMEMLLKEKVGVIFGYPGGAIMPTYDAIYSYRNKIHHVLVRHEQGAVHAAEGYARITNKTGVCIATSGPGATNLVTGIFDAMLDSIPLVCITGQVSSNLIGGDAFQEADVVGITTPITKWNYQITKASEIPDVFTKAFYIAQTGRPGPVVIDVTKDAQLNKFDFLPNIPINLPSYRPKPEMSKSTIQKVIQLINRAKRPLIIAGHGILISGAEREFELFVNKTGIPVAVTIHGLSAISSKHPMFVGMVGMHGNVAPNILTNKADVIIALGMRFDDRVTSALSTYAKQAEIIHVDIDKSELHKNVYSHLPVHADIKDFLVQLNKNIHDSTHPEWFEEFKKHEERENKIIKKPSQHPITGPIRMAEVIRLLSDKADSNTIIVSDVGQNQMMTARYFEFRKPRTWVTSGGSGTMGFGLPASIGAQFASPRCRVVAVLGDGGFQMTMQELGTIAQEKLPVKIIILSNGYLGMVRQWQELFFHKRYSYTPLWNPDFVGIAQSYGIQSKRVSKRAYLEKGMDDLLLSKGAFLLEIEVMKEDNVFPMVATGESVSNVRLY